MGPVLINIIALFLMALNVLLFEGDQQQPAPASAKVSVSTNTKYKKGTDQT